MIAALLVLQALTAVPGFERAPPSEAERIALPHVADALRAATPEQRRASIDAAIALLPQPTRFRGAVQCVRGSFLMAADAAAQRDAANSPASNPPTADRIAATAAIDECWRLNPDVPVAQRIKADAAFVNGDWRVGARLLAQALTRDVRLARGLREEQLDTIFRQLGYAEAADERRALVLALAKTDVARDNAALYSGWARAGVLDRVEKGDLPGAAALLPYVVDPSDGIVMLVDRRYEALWPRVDEWAGGDLIAQRDAMLAAARAAYQTDPRLERARGLAGVLGRTGHAAEAVTLLRGAIDAAGEPRDDYDYARGAVRLSGLIAQTGERDPDRVLAPMRDGLKEGSGVYRINLVPNLARAEIALGRPQAALATLDRFPVDATKVEAREAIGYFVALRGCAQAKLGQAAAAKAALAEVTTRYAANLGAVDMATACIGGDAQILARWIARVDDPDTRSGALVAMYAARMGVEDDVLSLTDRGLRAIAGRREVGERLARYGRAPATGYVPAMRGWRG